MSMKGDLPGLSKRASGFIGSYQYSTLRLSAAAAASLAGSAAGAALPCAPTAAPRHCATP